MSIRDARTVMADIAALGLPPEAMALMMELAASLASSAQPVSAPKSKAALRTERWRDKQRHKTSQNVTGDASVTVGDEKASPVTVCDADVADSPPLPPPPPSFPQTPNQPPPPPAPPCEPDAGAREGSASGLFGDDGRKPAGKQAKTKSSKADEPFALPDGIPADAWAGFEEMRKRKRAFLTDRARRGIVKKLLLLAENGQPPGAVLDQSTMNSWTDVYALKDQQNGTGNRSSFAGQHGADFRDPVLHDLAFGTGS